MPSHGRRGTTSVQSPTWSGVRRLLIAGHGPEVEDLTGFDEGPPPRTHLASPGFDTPAMDGYAVGPLPSGPVI
ncbi:hypothetical protein [Streptomyces sp. NBC_00696]|uniref:hypothetical protein n=1 Tax=Streptomyces sp. NBC_00696 TaxID=2903672 RepID=UPI002E3376A3|nr:hypothetical protein [Streptomyces sp. NBC_00696]